jgi:macrodomain Ter protein organizer (MatP/YcbG family)
MFSKKIVNRAAEIEVKSLNGDKADRDNRTGKIYMLRSNWQMSYTLKEVAKGQAITEYSDFSMVQGEGVANVAYVSRPQKVSEIIAHLAKNVA